MSNTDHLAGHLAFFGELGVDGVTWSPTRTLGPSRLRRRLPADTRRAWSAHPQIALGELWIWVTPVKWIPPVVGYAGKGVDG